MAEANGDCKLVKLVLDPAVRDLCRRPYPGHPNGCPNYGRKQGCPPAAKMLGELVDCSQPVWAVYVRFDLEAQRQRMWFKHPKWSKRQAECCLYWQGKVGRHLETLVATFILTRWRRTKANLWPVYRPEANGVNVTETMASAGIKLPWPPDDLVYKIALVGTRREDQT